MKNIIKQAVLTSPLNFQFLSQREINVLKKNENSEIYDIFRSCALAVLCIDEESDDPDFLRNTYTDFDINIIQTNRGVKLELLNAPSLSFVDGQIIQGVKEHVFAVMRDVLHVHDKTNNDNLSFSGTENITNSVFDILRNTNVFVPGKEPNLIVCWGGHSINEEEYDYSKKVGYHLGLRGMDICTGCGMGAMKGPMKGAVIAHEKIRHSESRFVGLSEPGIIAAESPNPIVNNLIIMPDIEKRLEAFVRISHGIVVFPGGAGTAEELLYLIGILLHPDNSDIDFPVIISGPESSKSFILQLDDFIRSTIGEEGCSKYKISFDPEETARYMLEGTQKIHSARSKIDEAFYFNWGLKINKEFQIPFPIDHDVIRNLKIHLDLPKHELAANLRRLFSVIVAGNIKPDGVKAVREHGPFLLNCDEAIVDKLDELLKSFVSQHRMKLPSNIGYTPCYKLLK
jgi:predicted Rossmann-fold nucleotide-binding protein